MLLGRPGSWQIPTPWPVSDICRLQTAVCSLQSAVSAVCSLQSAVCSLQSAVCSLQSAVCSLQSAVCSLQSAVCSLQSAVISLQSAICLQSANVRHRPLAHPTDLVLKVRCDQTQTHFAKVILPYLHNSS